MIKAYITSGPIGSGKTTYCHRLLEQNPRAKYIEFDQLAASLPHIANRPYGVGGEELEKIMLEEIKVLLSGNKTCTIIVDKLNFSRRTRKDLVGKLYEFGAKEVHCLLFTTDVDTCIRWFNRKVNKHDYDMTEDALRMDHKRFLSEAQDIDSEGFTSVKRINVKRALIRL